MSFIEFTEDNLYISFSLNEKQQIYISRFSTTRDCAVHGSFRWYRYMPAATTKTITMPANIPAASRVHRYATSPIVLAKMSGERSLKSALTVMR